MDIHEKLMAVIVSWQTTKLISQLSFDVFISEERVGPIVIQKGKVLKYVT